MSATADRRNPCQAALPPPAPKRDRPAPSPYLLAARALRDFGDGFVAILLPVYLTALGFSPLEVGAVATAAFLARRC